MLSIAGIALIGAYFVMTYQGLGASLNLGDPAKFEFILVPLWQIGLAVGAAGAVLLLISSWFKGASD